jgi:hypothetical protein
MLTIMYRATYTWLGFSFPAYMESCMRSDELSPVYALVYMLRPLKLKKWGLKLKFKPLKLKKRGWALTSFRQLLILLIVAATIDT